MSNDAGRIILAKRAEVYAAGRMVAASLYLVAATRLRLPQRIVEHAVTTLSSETVKLWFARAQTAGARVRVRADVASVLEGVRCDCGDIICTDRAGSLWVGTFNGRIACGRCADLETLMDARGPR